MRGHWTRAEIDEDHLPQPVVDATYCQNELSAKRQDLAVRNVALAIGSSQSYLVNADLVGDLVVQVQ